MGVVFKPASYVSNPLYRAFCCRMFDGGAVL